MTDLSTAMNVTGSLSGKSIDAYNVPFHYYVERHFYLRLKAGFCKIYFICILSKNVILY